MGANSEEWEEDVLDEMAKHLVQVASYIFKYQTQENRITKTELLQQVIFSLNSQRDRAIQVHNNYHQRAGASL